MWALSRMNTQEITVIFLKKNEIVTIRSFITDWRINIKFKLNRIDSANVLCI